MTEQLKDFRHISNKARWLQEIADENRFSKLKLDDTNPKFLHKVL